LGVLNMDKTVTDLSIRAFLKTAAVNAKIFVGCHGLHLKVSQAGSALWLIKYRLNGEKTYSLNASYPEMSLAEARDEARRVHQLVIACKDPVVERRLRHAALAAASDDKFEEVAEQWLAKNQPDWSAVHYTKSKRALERDVFPKLGKLPISSITAAMVAKTVEQVCKRGAVETGKRILQHINGIFKFADAKGLCDRNPAASAGAVLPKATPKKRMAALLDWGGLGKVLRDAKMARVSPAVYHAHLLLAYTATRISNVVEATWSQFHLDLEQPEWVIPRAQLKKKDRRLPDLVIPLPPALAAELKNWRKLTGDGFAFPSPSRAEEHISREALEKFYRETLNLQGQHTPHGWRSSMTTLAKDTGMDKDAIQIATDHAHASDTEMRYDRGWRWPQRIELFTWWERKLREAEAGNVIALPRPQRAAR
jgi:integrase